MAATPILLLILTNYIITSCGDPSAVIEDDKDEGGGAPDVIDDVTLNREYKNIGQEENIRDLEDYDQREATISSETTTDIPEALGLKNETAILPDSEVTADVTETTDYTMSSIDNNVYKSKDGGDDIYPNSSDNYSVERTDTTTHPTTIAMDEVDPLRPPEQLDEMEAPGLRSPKTDSSETSPPVDMRNPEPKPSPAPAVSKSSVLKSWLEDTWLRPPAGLLVPLRPMALNRALAIWNDLTAVGLNVSDIVIVGYDTNGVNWRSRHNLQHSSGAPRDRDVSEALSKLLLKYQGVNPDSSVDGTMRALASAAKLVPYDSALFVITDKGAGDPQRLPLALRALVEKRLKVYTIWTDPSHPSLESEESLQVLRNISRHTEGDVLPYSLQVMDVETPSNLASEMDLEHWASLEVKPPRHGRVNPALENNDIFDTLLVRRGGAEAISLGLPIESGVSALKVLIEGAVDHAVLYPPNDAPQIDLYNESSVAAFSPSSRIDGASPRDVYLVFPGAKLDLDMLSVIPANPSESEPQAAMVGSWHLSVRCDTCDYRLCVSARSNIHLHVQNETPGTLRIRVTGPVATVRESLLVDEYGAELAKLPFSCQPLPGDGQDPQVDLMSELVADVAVPPVKGSKVYVKIVGRDIQGDPFVRLAGPLSQPEVRMGRSASLVFPDTLNDLEAVEEANVEAYSRLLLNDTNVIPSNRAVSQVVNQRGILLTAVQIGLSTKLYGSPGDSIQLHFEVTNFREQAVRFDFGAVGELRFLTGINPTRQVITSGQTVNVIVSATISASAQPGARDFVTFTAYGLEQVSISAYIYVVNPSQSITDVWAPEVRHSFQGSCFGRMGSDCAEHAWSTTVVARDALGGLLRLTSSPIGLNYESNFISGTRDDVVVGYRATCCAPRVLITAVDAYGNVNSYIVDISNYISEAGIAAIVLGVLLAILVILLIAYLIYWCVRRKRETRELPYTTSSRNLS